MPRLLWPLLSQPRLETGPVEDLRNGPQWRLVAGEWLSVMCCPSHHTIISSRLQKSPRNHALGRERRNGFRGAFSRSPSSTVRSLLHSLALRFLKTEHRSPKFYALHRSEISRCVASLERHREKCCRTRTCRTFSIRLECSSLLASTARSSWRRDYLLLFAGSLRT